jgi:hypothetical protein
MIENQYLIFSSNNLYFSYTFEATKFILKMSVLLDINHRIALKTVFSLECICTEYGRTVQCVNFKSPILSVITDGEKTGG